MNAPLRMIDTAVPPDAPAPRPGETQWFCGHTIPQHHGVYRRLSISGETRFSRWDGAWWYWNSTTPLLAARAVTHSLIQNLPWCGLAAPATWCDRG